jgi:rubrerythrin
VPENFDEEEGSSHLLTPYRALAVAVRNEERAFAFFSYIAAAAPDEKSRKIAEELAKDELAHAWLLRRERRKAYRSEARDRPSAEIPETVEALWGIALETEARAGAYHRALAEADGPRGAADAFADAADDELACAEDLARRLGRDDDERMVRRPVTTAGGLRLLEAAFERYADITERSKDEAVMHEAQHLATRAVERLSLVRAALRGVIPEG